MNFIKTNNGRKDFFTTKAQSSQRKKQINFLSVLCAFVVKFGCARRGCGQSRATKKRIYQSCAFIIIAIGLVNPAKAQKKTFDLDDILRLPIVTEAAISPHGDWIAGKWFRRWLSDSAATETIAPGVTRRFMAKAPGPWRINVVEIDWKQAGLEIASARAYDHFLGRETTSSMAARHSDSLRQVIAALNADFFDLKTGEIENNQIIAGEFVKGVKITGSPHDTFDNVHSQFAISFDGRPFIERFAFAGKIIWRDGSMNELSGVNAVPDSNALVIFNHYYGTASPRDSLQWGVAEIELAKLTERQDTLIYCAQKKLPRSGGATIPRNGLILAGYHNSQKLLTGKLAVGDTIKMILGLSPARGRIKTLTGGWPRIVVNGKNIAAGADGSEGTFPRFSANRHPRSGVGFSADSTKLYFVTVDGRQEASAGMSLVEFADLMISLGIYQGLNLDGGGSTTLVVNGKVINSPSDRTGERPVGNCLLLLIKRQYLN